VSYASQDRAAATRVVEALEKQGLRCWIAPRNVTPGSLYADEIVRAINEARVVVAVMSDAAVASPHVGKEIERASSKRRRIVALHLGPVALPRSLEYFLSESQWIDAGSDGIDAAAARLAEAVRQHLGASTPIECGGASASKVASRLRSRSNAERAALGGVAILVLILGYLAINRYVVLVHPTTRSAAAEGGPSARKE